jgi:hypothetical protein
MEVNKLKIFITTIVMAVFLAGCGQSQRAESERKLAEAEKKLDEATKALNDVQQAAAQSSPTTTQSPRLESPAVERARADVRNSADQVVSSAKSVREKTAAETNEQTREQVRKAAISAEARAEEARRLAAPPVTHTLAAGTAVKIRTTNQLSTKTSTSGSPFEASLDAPLAADGYVIATRGAAVQGVITESDDGGRIKGRASLSLSLRHITLADGRNLAIQTDSEGARAASGVKKDALKVGIASGIGAAIGAIAGGGRGAAIGAGAGAAGGTGLVLGTKGQAAVIAAESLLTFRLTAPVTVQETRR